MTKRFCDICQKEILPNKENSMYIFVEWRMALDKGMQPFQTQEEYCDDCTGYFKDKREEKKKELKKE